MINLIFGSMTLGTMNHASNRENIIPLTPLKHQVGGHFPMFLLNDGTVCKQLVDRERQFYGSLPPDIKKFTPKFKGQIPVRVEQGVNDTCFTALLSSELQYLSKNSSLTTSRRYRRSSSGSVEYGSDEEDDAYLDANTCSSQAEAMFPGFSADVHNDWQQQCQQSYLHKLKERIGNKKYVEFILLENLTSKMNFPCILDLKMGIQQFGDDAPPQKRVSQTAKAERTTTATLGVRLVGMQVYNHASYEYEYLNKYDGRKLTEEKFKTTLRQFLSDGYSFRNDIAHSITYKLQELHSVIAGLDSFRFFTSSLLILYDISEPRRYYDRSHDGDRKHPRQLPECQVRREQTGLKFDHQDPPMCARVSRECGLPKNATEVPYQTNGKHKRVEGKMKVDVRLIDFAHATHRDMKDSKIYTGPDEDFLLGLNSLIKIFHEIQEG